MVLHADSGVGNLHGANPQVVRYEYGFNSANTGIVPESFQEDPHRAVEVPQSHRSFNHSARHQTSPGSISSTRDPLQEPLRATSVESVNADWTAMAQDLEFINESRQPEDNHIGGHPYATVEGSYRNQAPGPVPEDNSSMPKPGSLLGEGYGHRDLQDVQESHPEPASQGQAPEKARARKKSKEPYSIAGSPNQTKKPRGHRKGPMTNEGKAHAARMRKGPRKDCIHRRNKQKVILR